MRGHTRPLSQDDALAASKRFWGKVDRRGSDECWLWTASLGRMGYGQFGFRPTQVGRETSYAGRGSIPMSAHRVAYTMVHGAIPQDGLILHTCDVRRCVNPAHLYLGTPWDNVNDMFTRGRDNHVRGEKHRWAKLTAEQVAEIRARYVPFQVTQGQLAKEYGVSNTSIFNIVSGKSWPDRTRYKGSVR